MKQSYMYVIADSVSGPIKLGISTDPERRVKQLQTGHAQRLQLYHQEPVPEPQARPLERQLHRQIAHLRTHGEWFDLCVTDGISHVRFTVIDHGSSELLLEPASEICPSDQPEAILR